MRRLWLFLYYAIAKRFPTQPVPGWKAGYSLRRWLVARIVLSCGADVLVKQNCYFGTGASLRIGNRAQLGQNARIDQDVTLGDDVVMGPDVIIMTAAHAFDDPTVTVRLQGSLPRQPVIVGNDVWLGARVVILPGVSIGDGAVVGANAVVTKDIPPLAIAAGNPARVVRFRGQRRN
jgi:maltose O-acetyltransferase